MPELLWATVMPGYICCVVLFRRSWLCCPFRSPAGSCDRREAVYRCRCLSFFFSSRRRHTRLVSDWSSDVCSSDLRSSIAAPLKNTMILTLSAVVIGKTLAILLGVFSAVRQYSIGDYILTGITFISYSVPAFWLGLMLMIAFSVKLGWLPTSGIVNADLPPGSWEATADWIKHMILTVTVLALSEIIQVQRFMRSSLLEVLRQDYLTTARAKGLSESVVIGRHALRKRLIPFVTSIAVA